MRKFILVTAAKSEPGKSDVHAAGIRKLKRGVTVQEFIHAYFSELTIDNTKADTLLESSNAHVLERNGTYTVVYHTGSMVLMWSFTEYRGDDLLRAVKYLSKEELLRDMKDVPEMMSCVKGI